MSVWMFGIDTFLPKKMNPLQSIITKCCSERRRFTFRMFHTLSSQYITDL